MHEMRGGDTDERLGDEGGLVEMQPSIEPEALEGSVLRTGMSCHLLIITCSVFRPNSVPMRLYQETENIHSLRLDSKSFLLLESRRVEFQS